MRVWRRRVVRRFVGEADDTTCTCWSVCEAEINLAKSSQVAAAPPSAPWRIMRAPGLWAARLLLLSGAGHGRADEGVGGGVDRMAMAGKPAADLPDALSHLSNAERRAATEGSEMVELKLLADGQPVIMDSPIYLKYEDLYQADLWEAAKLGDVARLKELLDEGHAVDERQDGATPMYWAQYYLQPEAMEFLLDRGADPNAKELVRLAPVPAHMAQRMPADAVRGACARPDWRLLPAARCRLPQGGLRRLCQTAAGRRGAPRRALGAPSSLLTQTHPHVRPLSALLRAAVHDDALRLRAMAKPDGARRVARSRGDGARADQRH